MPQLVEKYRPQEWDEVKGQQHVVEPMKEMIIKSQTPPLFERPPNMLLTGPSGTGKTTMILIFARKYLGEHWQQYFYEYNGSDERGIDFVREIVKPISRVAVKQIVFITEADYITEPAQAAYRRIMEQSKNTVFIFDLNNSSKFIDALKSRCAEFTFKPLHHDVIMERLISICQSEGITLKYNQEEEEGFEQIIRISRGDLRKSINELEKIITSNKEINAKNVLESIQANIVIDSIKYALNGDFTRAKNYMEDAYIKNSNTDMIMDGLTEAISQITSEEIKIRLFYELGELEHRLQTTHRPLIPLTSFLSYVWIVPHLKK